MTNLPQFIRFERVEFHYRTLFTGYTTINAPTLPIAEKCQSVVNYLQLLKLDKSNLIHFNGVIDRNNRSHFSNLSQLVDHLRNELLQICGSSRGYKFEIFFYSYEVSHTNIITQILQVPQIGCSSSVDIIFHGNRRLQFPIEPISNWLHRNCDGIEEKSRDRILRICSLKFPCARELIGHLTKVTFLLTLNNFWLSTLEV